MSILAASSSCPDWTAAYASYDERVLAHSKTGKRRAKLVALDEFVRNDMPTRLEARLANDDSGASKLPDGYLTKEEVCKIVEWKITRGKFRPLMRYANALNATEVEDVTASAFSEAGTDLSSALETLTSLKGIGPATASAILSFGCRDGACPFLSDEAMRAFGIVGKADKLEYTLASWKRLREACAEKAEELNGKLEREAKESESADNETWTPCKVERALWAASVSDE